MRSLTYKQKIWLLALLNGGTLLIATLYVIAYRYATAHGYGWFDCIVRDTIGIYCPSCGGSRSVNALLSLDLLGAWRYYPPIPITVLLLCEVDVRLCFDLLTRGERGMSTYRPWRWLIVLIAILVTFLVRLLAVTVWGVDPLGDLHLPA
ncbi:MAG: DUF2752 domain-containing protein [Clostridia bacterium]|nr:DUF2752 domain-containing protein [Clostridia bacterium]